MVRSRLLAAIALCASTPLVAQARPFDYRLDVTAWLARAGCSAADCHGGATGRGGFKLSLFGSDPWADHRALTTGARPRVVSDQPAASRLLRKPSLDLEHDGGLRLPQDGAGFAALRDWIANGARAPNAPESPTGAMVATVTDGRMTVVARRPDLDGGVLEEDLSDRALFRSSDPRVATIDPDGRVVYVGSGRAVLTAKVLDREAHCRVVRPLGAAIAAPGDAEHPIDRAWLDDLRELGLPPAQPAADHELLRRLHLDLTARLPTPRERREFLALDVDLRVGTFADRLLASEEFLEVATHWIAQCFEWEGALPRPIADRIARSIREDESLLVLVSDAVAARSPLLWRAPDPRDRAERFAESVLGVRMQCARCHDHPLDRWRQDDHLGLSAYFVDPRPAAEGGMMEGLLFDPRDHRPAVPRMPDLLGADSGEGPLAVRLAAALRSSPRVLARNLGNRIVAMLAGAAPVQPIDDHRPGNPARSPALLDTLTDRLLLHDFRLRPFVREIVTSRFYARSSTSASDDPTADGAAREYFAVHPTREIDDATLRRATSLALALPVGQAAERAPSPLSRSLAAWNSVRVHEDLAAPGNLLELIALEPDSRTQIEALFHVFLVRDPKPAEIDGLRTRLGDAALDLAALRALTHAITLSREFRSIR